MEAASRRRRRTFRIQWNTLWLLVLVSQSSVRAFAPSSKNLRLFQQSTLSASASSSSVVKEANGADKRLPATEPMIAVPKHVAFVCDGNSRWAKARHLPTAAGHAAGAERLIQILQCTRELGVEYCTMYGFSTENWQRPPVEIAEIFHVMEATVKRYKNFFLSQTIVLKILGDLDDTRIPQSLRETLRTLENDTYRLHNNKEDAVTLCVAINYGGRQDILNASRKLAQQLQRDPDFELTEASFSTLLDTANVPDPDLIIRTSGETRLSNFLLWNSAYSELYFTETYWPDFDEENLQSALQWYQSRKRRFGKREE